MSIYILATIVLCFAALFFTLEARRRAYGKAIADAYEERIKKLRKVSEGRIACLDKCIDAYKLLLEAKQGDYDLAHSSAVYGLEQERAVRSECAAWEAAATFLWERLDDIDTLDDSCRDNHIKFRERVRATQKRRTEVADSDGYGLTWKHLVKENP